MKNKNEIKLGSRLIGINHPPLVIPEIGINHEGNIVKAKQMILDAYKAGAECVKFQCHVIDDEMLENNVIPKNANESIWTIMKRTFTATHKINHVNVKLSISYLISLKIVSYLAHFK